MRHLVPIICTLTFMVIPGCSQVQLEKQKAELRHQQAEIQKLSAELTAVKSELSEAKQKNIDLAAKSDAAVQSLTEAVERNQGLQTELSEVRDRQQAAVKLLTAALEPSLEDETADSSTQNNQASQDDSSKGDAPAKSKNDSEVKMKPSSESELNKVNSTATSQR